MSLLLNSNQRPPDYQITTTVRCSTIWAKQGFLCQRFDTIYKSTISLSYKNSLLLIGWQDHDKSKLLRQSLTNVGDSGKLRHNQNSCICKTLYWPGTSRFRKQEDLCTPIGWWFSSTNKYGKEPRWKRQSYRLCDVLCWSADISNSWEKSRIRPRPWLRRYNFRSKIRRKYWLGAKKHILKIYWYIPSG